MWATTRLPSALWGPLTLTSSLHLPSVSACYPAHRPASCEAPPLSARQDAEALRPHALRADLAALQAGAPLLRQALWDVGNGNSVSGVRIYLLYCFKKSFNSFSQIFTPGLFRRSALYSSSKGAYNLRFLRAQRRRSQAHEIQTDSGLPFMDGKA